MSLSLPFDVLQMILDTVDDKKTLASCCLVSKTLLDIAQPLLHRSLDVTIREHKDGEASDMAADRGEIYEAYEAFHRFLPYLRTLEEHPHLKAYVQNFNVSGSRMMTWRVFDFIHHPVTSFRESLQVLPALRNVTLLNPLFLDEVDDIIYELQQSGLGQPAFHLAYLQHRSIEVYGMLKGSYRSFTTDDHHLVHRASFANVFNTVASVKLQCASDFGDSTLDTFSSIKTLELHATTYQKWNPILRRPQPPSRRLHNSLSRSSTLETVIISGSLCPALVEILSPPPSGIVASFPPSVSSLSTNAKVSIATLVDLVRSLPLSTGIRTLKIRSIEGDLRELPEECQKRGIKLALA